MPWRMSRGRRPPSPSALAPRQTVHLAPPTAPDNPPPVLPLDTPGVHGPAVALARVTALLVLAPTRRFTPAADVEVLTASLLPVVLGFLLVLERRALPAGFRMHGIRRLVTYILTGLVITLGLYTGFQALTGHL